MRRIEVTGSTMGRANPSPVTLSGGYRFKGREGWPFDPATHDKPDAARPVAAHGSRAGRVARYCEARDSGQDKAQAAETVGVSPETARDYERDYQAAKTAGQEGDGDA